MSDHARQITRNASVVAGATLLSRVLGFARDLIVAFALGAGPLADAFFVAFRLPNLLRRLFAEGSLTMAFVPVFTRMRQTEGDRAAFVLARSIQVWLLIILGAIVLAAMVFAEPITLLVAPGFSRSPELLATTTTLVRICFPYILFISAVALCMGVLNAMDHFLAPALAPCMLNIVLIVAALTAVGMGLSVPHALSWGVLVAGVAQWTVQQPFLRQKGFSWWGQVGLLDTGVKRIGRLMGPSVLGSAVYQINILLGTVLASFLPLGSISYLYYADRLVQFPLGIFGVAIGTAALPSLSGLAGRKDWKGFGSGLSSALNLTLFISLPAAAGLGGLAEPIVELLFERGAFTGPDVVQTALALQAYALGLPAFSCVRSLVAAFYALEDTRTPVWIAMVCLCLNISLGLILMQFYDHVGLAAATSLSSWANVVLLVRYLGRKQELDRLRPSSALGKMLVLSGCVLAGTMLTAGHAVMAFALIPVWVAGFIGVAIWWSVPEVSLLLGVLRRKKQEPPA
ncbi:murein biosynthesis integral membrane protein MurJ [Desulfoplanes formicivorans]|uniref:Probable lipid II flippase MurJ n=1 Tax=Desulfoplanes formicivorans TaxID=1592317 RepID=A0A194AEH5_9BACT|nr:murein biosynthesis integral membrane protein MurJ [Desulfoplanes formicivorans]GAU07728.1 integral membrane protein MviN [Desulfoplanes formicivorans]